MFNQLTRSQLPVRRKLIGRSRQIFHDRLFFFAQISVTQFGPHFLRFNLTETGVDRDPRDPVLERHLPGKLRELLKHFNENHLAKILFTSSSRSMRADHFCDKRIEAANQLASCRIVMAQRALNQRICVTIIHVVVEAVSTLLTMTGVERLRLQISLAEADKNKM